MPRRPTPYILAFHRYGVPGITDESGREVGLAGFTWVPFYGTKGSLWDGVHISSESFAFDHNRQHPFTMVHEVAHYLGLQVLRRFRDASEALTHIHKATSLPCPTTAGGTPNLSSHASSPLAPAAHLWRGNWCGD